MTIEFLDLDDLKQIHGDQLREFGGRAGLRDEGLLESAVAQPMATFGGDFVHAGLFEMAAAYLFHVVRSHPFIDGNKRTGLLAALLFLDVNGIILNDPSDVTSAVSAPPTPSDMCCPGPDDKKGSWCPRSCENDGQCPPDCVCSCLEAGCSASLITGTIGDSNHQCVSRSWLVQSGLNLKDGGVAHLDE